jgi:hypothetical protein
VRKRGCAGIVQSARIYKSSVYRGVTMRGGRFVFLAIVNFFGWVDGVTFFLQFVCVYFGN